MAACSFLCWLRQKKCFIVNGGAEFPLCSCSQALTLNTALAPSLAAIVCLCRARGDRKPFENLDAMYFPDLFASDRPEAILSPRRVRIRYGPRRRARRRFLVGQRVERRFASHPCSLGHPHLPTQPFPLALMFRQVIIVEPPEKSLRHQVVSRPSSCRRRRRSGRMRERIISSDNRAESVSPRQVGLYRTALISRSVGFMFDPPSSQR
jgi:hypothetical protein